MIAIFGAIGTLSRYGIQSVLQFGTGANFPWGTLLINLTGCFFLGLIGQITLNRMVISPDWRTAITVGFFGGYTTFSSFGLDTLTLVTEGRAGVAAVNVAVQVGVGISAVFAAYTLALRLS